MATTVAIGGSSMHTESRRTTARIACWLAGAIALSAGAIPTPAQTSKPASQPESSPASRAVHYKFTVSKETTFVLGPLNADGTVNYVAAYNEMMVKGLRPADNAAILFIRALGPAFFGDANYGSRILEWLALPAPPAKGDYYISQDKYVSAAHPEFSEEKRKEYLARLWEFELEPNARAPFKAADRPELAEWLKANAKPLDLIVQASKCRGFFVPWVSLKDPQEMMDGLMRYNMASLRALARALGARALLRAGEGDFDGASADLLAIHRFSRVLPRGTLIEYLVALSIESLATDFDTSLARAGKAVTAEQFRKHLQALESLPPFPDPTATWDGGERLFSLDFGMMIAREGLNEVLARLERESGNLGGGLGTSRAAEVEVPEVPMDFDEFLRLYNAAIDRVIAFGRLPSFARRKCAFAAMDDDLLPAVKDARKEAPGGLLSVPYRKRLSLVLAKVGTSDRKMLARAVQELLSASDFFAVGKPYELWDRSRARFDLAKVALALAAYRAERGSLPEDLGKLVPGYVKKLPADPFTEKPIIYRRDGKTCMVYSVGPNMRDDGGEHEYAPLARTTAPAPADPMAEMEDDIAVKLE